MPKKQTPKSGKATQAKAAKPETALQEEDIYDVSGENDWWFADYINAYGTHLIKLQLKATIPDLGWSEEELLENIKKKPITSFSKRYEYRFDALKTIHPKKIARLDKLAAYVNAGCTFLEFKMVVNEVARLIRGKQRGIPLFPEKECDPDLLKID